MNSDFENHLQRQPLREIPPQWRGRILSAAVRPAPVWWRELLWPCPQAWAALAAVWVLILGVNAINRAKVPEQLAQATPPLSQDAMAEIRQQQETLAELIFPAEATEVEPPKPAAPRRSELRQTLLIV